MRFLMVNNEGGNEFFLQTFVKTFSHISFKILCYNITRPLIYGRKQKCVNIYYCKVPFISNLRVIVYDNVC